MQLSWADDMASTSMRITRERESPSGWLQTLRNLKTSSDGVIYIFGTALPRAHIRSLFSFPKESHVTQHPCNVEVIDARLPVILVVYG